MTLSSMTGFARSEGALGDWTWAVEARSVNGRNLEVRFRGPPGFDSLERPTRDAAQALFQRGQINVNVQGKRVSAARRARVNMSALEGYLTIGKGLVAESLAGPARWDGLLALPGVLETGDQEEDAEGRAALDGAMMEAIALAFQRLLQSRQAEGDAIKGILSGFLDRIGTLIADATFEATEQPMLIKAKFERRLQELVGEAASEDRIVQEAAAQALKADVREEIDRLVSHVAAARTLLAADGATGRRLDFLTQEFMREANTLCAKSATASLTAIGLELKATIDQFREQVQNVE